MKRALTAGIVLALPLLGAAPAHAAFAPDLAVAFDPPTASGTPAVTMAIAQPATNSPVQRFTLALPPGFTATGAPGAGTCAPATLRSGGCSPASQIGVFAGRLAGGHAFGGAVHKTGPASFGLFLSALGGSVGQLVTGAIDPRPNGSLNVRFDGLPALPLTVLTMRLYGGARGVVRTPDTCGGHTIDGLFTSRLGELAIDRSAVAISGCTGVPAVAVANVRLSRKRFRPRNGTIIAWWASRAVDHTNVRIERRKRGRWRAMGVLVGPAAAGDNRLRWNGRVRGRALRPGRYTMRIQPAGAAPSKRFGFRVTRR